MFVIKCCFAFRGGWVTLFSYTYTGFTGTGTYTYVGTDIFLICFYLTFLIRSTFFPRSLSLSDSLIRSATSKTSIKVGPKTSSRKHDELCDQKKLPNVYKSCIKMISLEEK